MHKLVWIGLLVGCGGGAVEGEDPLAQLRRETASEWKVRRHDDGTAAWLEGRGPPSAGMPATAARGFLQRYGPLFGLGPEDQLVSRSVDTDELGMVHVRFDQQRNGMPVVGGELVVHFDHDGSLVRVNGHGRQISSGSVSAPVFDETQAIAAAKLMAAALAVGVKPELLVARTPSIWVWPVADGSGRPVWRVEVEVRQLDAPRLVEVLVDAVDGTLLRRHEGLRRLHAQGTGFFGDPRALEATEHGRRFWLEDGQRGGDKTSSVAGKDWLPGVVVVSSVLNRWDSDGAAAGAAVDVHAHLATIWDHFVTVHGLHGWKGDGHGVHASVHFGHSSNEAFFNGSILAFGDGDGYSWSPPGSALDLVAHEWSHGLIAATARLEPSGDAGAIGEAVADILAVLVSMPSGAVPDWKIGEQVFHPNGPTSRSLPLRNLGRPHDSGQAAHRRELVLDDADGGAVYFNAGVIAHAAFVMSEGSAGQGGLGGQVTEQIWYRALVRLMTSECSFTDVVDATLASARELGVDEQPVRAAWVEVGLLDAE